MMSTKLAVGSCASCRSREPRYTPAIMPEKLYDWSVTIGTACNKQSRTFRDLAEKLKMDVHQLMRECNGKVAPSKALVKGVARELDLSESMLVRLAEEVRKDLGAK